MIKRTLYFGNPAYLSLRNAQLVLRLPEVDKNDTLTASFKKTAERTIPIEDIFDLPTETKKERKIYADFRKRLLCDGFTMFQFSIYLRHCPSRENADAHIRRVKAILPPRGDVGILCITDKQFDMMEIFSCAKEKEKSAPQQQLELF